MRRGAGDDLEAPRVLQRAKAAHEVPVVAPPAVADLVETVAVHLCQLVAGAVLAPGAVDLLLGELDERVDLARVALLEQVVRHHRQERRAEAHREAEVDPVLAEPLEGEQERRVRLGDRLEEPLLLHVRGRLGMAHEGQVRVQDQGEVAARHVTSPFVPRARGARPSARGSAERCSLAPAKRLAPARARSRPGARSRRATPSRSRRASSVSDAPAAAHSLAPSHRRSEPPRRSISLAPRSSSAYCSDAPRTTCSRSQPETTRRSMTRSHRSMSGVVARTQCIDQVESTRRPASPSKPRIVSRHGPKATISPPSIRTCAGGSPSHSMATRSESKCCHSEEAQARTPLGAPLVEAPPALDVHRRGRSIACSSVLHGRRLAPRLAGLRRRRVPRAPRVDVPGARAVGEGRLGPDVTRAVRRRAREARRRS